MLPGILRGVGRLSGQQRPEGVAKLVLVMILAIVLLLPTIARAQGAQAGVNDLGSAPVIDRDRTDRVAPRLEQGPATPAASAPSPQVAPASPSAASVQLTRVRYEGSSLRQSVLDEAVAPFIGHPLTNATLQGVANAVTAAYGRSDIAFYAVSIPAQAPVGGQIKVRVVEGRIKNYTLSGISPSAPVKLIGAHMRRLMREAPLRKPTLERTLSLLRDIPGQTVNVAVRQMPTAGDLILDVIIKRKQIDIGLTIDNSGVSNVVEGVQAQLSVAAHGLIREGDSTRVSAYLPFYPDRYTYYSLSHSTPLGSNGLNLSANFAQVNTKSRGTQIKGEASLAGVSLTYPIIRSYKKNLSASLSLDGINSTNYYLDTEFGDYRSRAVRAGLSWSDVGPKNGYAASAVVSQGINAIGAKAFTGFSEIKFSKVNIQTIVVKTLLNNLTAKVTVKGQYSKDKLPVTERFSLGGRGAGMAYRIGTITSDQALASSLELSWSLPAKSPVLKATSLFAYVDGAVAHAVARPYYGIAAQDYSLASAGGGVRVGVGEGWRASAEIALPVKRPNDAYSRKARFFFGLGRAF
ncbi:hemolysin activation/secretion protein [Sphingobium fuliginis]|uniref:Hemolysin activation/secretion protein n=1 Tax=Sphingobium fuliginis (strain ATCC 27551) TaxID=336203 RepID=A0A292Z9U9_SPHSA|nr:hemolysin activation/secretion protein [Sphingobium fuliginis]